MGKRDAVGLPADRTIGEKGVLPAGDEIMDDALRSVRELAACSNGPLLIYNKCTTCRCGAIFKPDGRPGEHSAILERISQPMRVLVSLFA